MMFRRVILAFFLIAGIVTPIAAAPKQAINTQFVGPASSAPGSQIWMAAGVPAANLGSVGDVYTDTVTDNVYQKTGAGWVYQMNIGGAQGPQGNPGNPGNNGTNGAAATISVGTVTPLSAGATPTIVNAGTSSAATFNFGIPAGATGPAGSSTNVQFSSTVTLGSVIAIGQITRDITVSGILSTDSINVMPATDFPSGVVLVNGRPTANNTVRLYFNALSILTNNTPQAISITALR